MYCVINDYMLEDTVNLNENTKFVSIEKMPAIER